MKRGISAIETTDDITQQEAFPFTLLDEILSEHVFPQVEDVYTLDALIKSSKRSRRLADTKIAWQTMVDKYFPYLSGVFPERYQNDPKSLFTQEFEVIKHKLDVRRSNLQKKHILAAMNHDLSVIEELVFDEAKLGLISLLIANGNLALIDDPTIMALEPEAPIAIEQRRAGLVIHAFGLAAWFGYETVVNSLMESLFKQVEKPSLRDNRSNILKSVFILGIKEALSNGHVELAKKILEKFRQVDNQYLVSEMARMLFSEIFNPTYSVINYQRNCWLSSLEYLCSFQDDNGDPFFTEQSIIGAIKHTAATSGNVEILKKLLSLKCASSAAPFSSNELLVKELLDLATANNHADIFIYLYETYRKQLNLTHGAHIKYIIASARYPVEDYSIVAYLAGIKDKSRNYLIPESTLSECIREGVYRNKTEMVNFLLHLSREGTLLKQRTDAVWMMQYWRSDDSELVQLILQCVIKTNRYQFNSAFIKKALEIYQENPAFMFKLFSKVKNKDGVLLIQDHRLMTQAMLLIDVQFLDNELVSTFIRDLTQAQFNEIKGIANFYQRDDLVSVLDEIRRKISTEKTQTLIFSLSGTNPSQRATEVTEPLAKKRRTKK